MSELTAIIDDLRREVQALEEDNAQLREVNSEWSELMNDYDADAVKTAVEFAADNDLDELESFLQSVDLDSVQEALRYNDINELVSAHNKIDEYGDPEEMAEKVERLEEDVRELENNTSDDSVHRDDYNSEVALRQDTQTMLNDTQNIVESQRTFINELKDTCTKKESAILSLQSALASAEEQIQNLDTSLYYKAHEELLEKFLDVSVRYDTFKHLYFSQVSGFDDVPSSAPDPE